MIWPLVLLFFLGLADAKCLLNRTDARRNYFQIYDSAQVITIESSDRLMHDILSNIFKILLEEELGYDAVQIVYGDSLNASAALDRVSEIDIDDQIIQPTTMINLEVWAESNFTVPRGQKSLEVGMIAPPGRFGWFVTNYANITWQTFQDLRSSSAFSLPFEEFKLIIGEALDKTNNLPYCNRSYCRQGMYSPSWCPSHHEQCAMLLVGDFDASQVVISHIEEFKLYVRVLWFGPNLKKVVDILSFAPRPRLVLTLNPGAVTASGEWYPVAFPPCNDESSAPGCVYETRRLVKLVSTRVEKGAPAAFEAASDMTFTREQYSDILKAAINSNISHYDIACDWMRNNEEIYSPWKPSSDEKPRLSICGIFPLKSAMFGAGGVALAAKMAVEAVNNNDNVLPHHNLILTNHNGDCNADSVMEAFINYILESNSKELVGILGPACSDTVEPLVGLTKYFRTVVISYSAEGSIFADRSQYPYFFRTIGENQQYKHVYLQLLQKLGWKRIAALTEDGQKYTEYLSHLQDLLQTHNLTFITHRKFPRHRANATMRTYLEDLRARRARIIVADVYDHAARAVMCEALKLKMTAAEGYVWFLPQWLSLNWYDMSHHKEDSKKTEVVDCTTSMMLEAIQGHFSLAHRTLAHPDQKTHEGFTVGEWFDTYQRRLNGTKSNHTVSAYAGYAYDAVWTYALALDELYRNNNSYLADIHSLPAIEKYVEIIQRTNFEGVSGTIQFLQASRLTDINIRQWIDGKYEVVGYVEPQMSKSLRKVDDYKLHLNKSKIHWFTEGKVQPNDGEDISSCAFQSLADFLNADCSAAIIFVNVLGFGMLAIALIVAIYLTKRRYDKKVQKLQITEKYMKSMGFDLVATNLPDLDKWEIPRDCVVINRRLGEGAFGTVYGGEAYFKELGWVAAAVKTLKVNSTTEQKLDFLSEAEVMKRFEHKNIVKLLGVCTRDEPVYTVMEFMLYGDLKTFLLNRRHLVNQRRMADESNEVSNKKLTAMALDIARGLSYLASLKYVHRDMACRNCLLNSSRVAKIGDFGLTRPMYENDYYKFSRKGMLPIRWMAPESLADGLFTPSSDVWSFGVVLYEIVTFGSYPFQGMSNIEVMNYVKAGNTIDIPKEIKPQLECLMKSCWNLDHKKRPSASEIVEFLANNPRLLGPCLDVPASSVALEDSEGLELPFITRPSAPASPLEPGSFFSENLLADTEEIEKRSPPASQEPNSSTSFFLDSAHEALLPSKKPVYIAMTPMSKSPSPQDLQSGSLL